MKMLIQKQLKSFGQRYDGVTKLIRRAAVTFCVGCLYNPRSRLIIQFLVKF